jgi:hypothetical protein
MTLRRPARSGCWELVDQSLNGKDFWQTNYIQEKGKFELIFNVNQDIANDATAVIKYYLGATPPTATMVSQSNLNATGWTSNAIVTASIGNKVQFAPQVKENGTTSTGNTGTWTWTGPNNFTATTRAITIDSVTATNKGIYTVTYKDAFGCSVSKDFEIVLTVLSNEDFTLNQNGIKMYPNPTQNEINIISNNETIKTIKIYNSLGYDVTNKIIIEKNTVNDVTLFLSNLPAGNYFAKINSNQSLKIMKK